jgi:branched-chain amino acid transport system substrate-binding protein
MKSKIIVIGVVLIFLALVFIGIHKKTDQDVIRVGVLAPLSGEYSAAGENMVKGITVARDSYVKSHPGSTVELVIEDDGFNVAKGVSAYKKLTGLDKVNAIISLSTPVIDAVYQDIAKTDMPVIQIGIQTVGIGPDNIFQNSPAAGDGIIALAEYSGIKLNLSRVAIVYDTTPGGTIFYNVFKDNYKNSYESFAVTKKDDIRSQVNKIISEKYDGVVMLNGSENGALITKELIRSGYKGQLIYDAQLQTAFADYERILGDTKIIDGAISIWFKDGDKTSFINSYKEKYSEEPGFIADFGYDSFNTLMNAYSMDNKEWLTNIQNTKTIGASGKVSFDVNGIRKQDISINQVINGKIVPIDTVEIK